MSSAGCLACRHHFPGRGGPFGPATFYLWKSKFGGLEVSEARRLRTLEEENARLKKLLAEAMLDNAVLKDLASKKWSRPARGGKPSPMPVRITG